MTDRIAHTIIVDNCMRIVVLSPEICQTFKDVLSRHLEFARMGSSQRGLPFPVLLEELLEGWDSPPPQWGGYRVHPEAEEAWREAERERTLAYVLGHMCYIGADDALSRTGDVTSQECGLYQDVHLIRDIYGRYGVSPYTPNFFEVGSPPGSQGFTSQEVEEFFRVLIQRCLMSFHTILPGKDFLDWLDRLIQLRHTCTEALPRYAEVFTNPDREKVRRYVMSRNFYDVEDVLVEITRRIQKGRYVLWEDIKEALESVVEQSTYAQALARGYRYVKAASQFWQKTISSEELLKLTS